jgi:Tfp pilus assembly protein PilE
MNKYIRIGFMVIGIIFAVTFGVVYYYGAQQQAVSAAHIADCKTHMLSYINDLEKYQADQSNIINGLITSTNGAQQIDRQNTLGDLEYIKSNCVDTMQQLKQDPDIASKAAAFNMTQNQ